MADDTGGGIFDEWKKASPKEKLFIGGAVGAVILIILYMASKSKGATPATGTGTSTGGGGGIQTAGGVPILPNGLCPKYNPTTGVLESYAPCGTSGIGIPSPAGPPGPIGKQGPPGKLPTPPVYAHPLPKQHTTTASTYGGRKPTGPAPTRITPPPTRTPPMQPDPWGGNFYNPPPPRPITNVPTQRPGGTGGRYY